MVKKYHPLLRGMKLWLLWNVLADLSLMVFFGTNRLALGIVETTTQSRMLSLSIMLLGIVLGSLFAGLVQEVAFMSRIKHSYGLILATGLGWSLAGILLLLYLLNRSESYVISSGMAILAGAIVGVLVGLPQWLVLRWEVLGAGRWLLGSVLGWVCVGFAIYLLTQAGMEWLVAYAYLLFGMITGVAYACLFTQSSP